MSQVELADRRNLLDLFDYAVMGCVSRLILPVDHGTLVLGLVDLLR